MAAGSDPVVVLGFSQGGAMALEVATPMPVAAVLAFSGYPHPDWQPGSDGLAPVFLAHGSNDPVVPPRSPPRNLQTNGSSWRYAGFLCV